MIKYFPFYWGIIALILNSFLQLSLNSKNYSKINNEVNFKKLTLIIILGSSIKDNFVNFFGDKVSNEWGIMLENLEQNQLQV